MLSKFLKQASIDQKVSAYLMASNQYYILGNSIMLDSEFDDVCMDLLSGFAQIQHHHKHLLDIDQLKAGTGYAIKEYPSIVQSASARFVK